MFDRHTVAQHAGNQLGIVPVFRIKLLAQSLNRNLIASLVHKLEVVSLQASVQNSLHNLAFAYRFRQHDTLVLILQARENFVWMTVEQSYQSHPFLLIILESDHIAFQFSRSHLHYFRRENREMSFLRNNIGYLIIEFIPIRLFYMIILMKCCQISIQFIYKSLGSLFKSHIFSIFHIKRFIFRCKIKLLFLKSETFWHIFH